MIKQATFFKRRSDLEPVAFHDYWRNRHPEFVCRIPGLKRYVQNHAIGDDGHFDGIAEVWFDDMDAMRANAAAPELEAVRADEANFLDTAGMASIITDEYVIKDGAPGDGTEKLMALVFRQEQHSPERFFELYRDELGGWCRPSRASRATSRPTAGWASIAAAARRRATPSRRSGSRTGRPRSPPRKWPASGRSKGRSSTSSVPRSGSWKRSRSLCDGMGRTREG